MGGNDHIGMPWAIGGLGLVGGYGLYRAEMFQLLAALVILMTASLAAFMFSSRRRNRYKALLFQAEQARRKAQEETRATLYGIGDGVIATDAAGNITRMNPVASNLTGWSEPEALGRPIREVFRILNEGTRAEEENPIDRVLREGRMAGLANHALLVAKDGSERPIADSAAPIHSEQGEIIGVVLVFRDQTAEREAQASLRESEIRYRALFERSLDAVYLHDLEGRFLDANPAALNDLGYTREEIPSLTFASLLTNEEDLARAIQGVQEIVATGMQREVSEYRLRRKDGTLVWFELQGSLVLKDGRPVAILGVGRNITGRKRVEEALLMTQFSVEHAADALYWMTSDGRIVSVNEMACRTLGYTREELLELAVPDIDPDFSPEVWRDAWENLKTHRRLTIETRHRTRDGSIIPVEITASYIEFGGREYSCAFVRDITQRKQAEAALRESEELFRRMIDAIPQMAAVAKPDGYICWYNQRWYEYTGTTPEQMEGWGWQSVHDPQVLPRVLEQWRNSIATGQPFDMEFPIRGADGHFRPFLTRILPVLNGQGQIVQWVGTNTDITGQKQMEAALHASEQLYRSLVEGTPDVITSFDRQGRHLFVSHAVTPLTGLQPHEYVGKTHAEMGFPEDQCRFWKEWIGTVFDSGEPCETEYECQFDGKSRIFNLRLIPVFSGGNVASVLSIARDITAHRKMEEQYQVLFRAMLNGFALYEILRDEQGKPADYRFLAVNPAFERLTGIQASDVLGKTILELWPDIEPYWTEFYERVALTGEPASAENYAGAMGRHYQVTAFRPAPNQFACIFLDVTERKLAEQALRASEARHAKMVENIGDVIAIIDRDGINRYKSPNLERWFGWKPEEIVGVSTWENVHPDDLAPIQQTFLELLSAPDTIGGAELRYRCKDGGYKWIEFTAVNLLHDPAIQGLLVNYRDITGRKRVEEALLREKELTEAIFDSTPGIIYLYDDQSRLVRWNKRHEEMTGYSAEELSRMGMLDWYGGDETKISLIKEGLKRTLQDGYGYAEVDLQRKDGSMLPMYLTASPLFIDGKTYFVGIGIDITERKRVEEEKEKLQAQLLQAQKMESVGRLAGGVAHDFNNMLGVILGHAEMALDEVDPASSLHDDLREIQKAAQRSADLTRQLLAFARKQTVTPKVLNMNETVSGMIQMLRRLIGENIELVWKPGLDLWSVKMDPSQLDQILANLSVNARDAIIGVGRITIETRNVTFDQESCPAHAGCAPGEYVMLKLSDTGSGMDKETLERLFEPFFTTKEVGKGTGLGLATVYGAVRQNCGFIEVRSAPGQGASFGIYIPRAETQEAGGAVIRQQPAVGAETVLLVEDEEAILKLSEAILKKHGYKVLTAQTPAEALSLSRRFQETIHLLITDVVMPEMNGKELKDKLKALRPEIKVLFMSGYTSDVIAHQGVINEKVAFLQKPFTAGCLAQKVRDVLQ